MNARFQSWFSQGKATEALCGLEGFFMPDVTYREEHDFVLAVGELMEWARQGQGEAAARAFDTASATLLEMGRFEHALRLLESYILLQKETQASLPLNQSLLASRFGRAAQEAAEELSRNERLRNLLLSVSRAFPPLRTAIGLDEGQMKQGYGVKH